MVYEISDCSNQGIGFGQPIRIRPSDPAAILVGLGQGDSASLFGFGQSDPAASLCELGQGDPAAIPFGFGQSILGFGHGDSAIPFGFGHGDSAKVFSYSATPFGFGRGDSAKYIQIRPWRFGHNIRIRPL